MPPRPTQAQRDASLDSLKWESGLAYVSAMSELTRIVKEHGALSKEAGAALKVVDKAKKAYNKVRTK